MHIKSGNTHMVSNLPTKLIGEVSMQQNASRNRAKRVVTWINQRRVQISFSVLATGFITGILFWGAFNTALEVTNTERFCISCHEMEVNVYQEYRNSAHFTNPTGVRATCPDCHVPKDWAHKVARKISATNELLHHFSGSIDTPEKFRAKRFELASMVWRVMEETDSRECRNCHSETAMALSDQRPAAAEQHELAQQQHKTCIDCHKGIAHQLPEEFLAAEHERYEKEKVDCIQCHVDMAHAQPGDEL